MRILLAATVVVTISAGPAYAEHNPANERDTRRCVTQREPWTTPEGLTRPEVERRWDVRNKGRLDRDRITGKREWLYPICDRSFPESYAAAVFNRRGLLVAVATYVDVPNPTQAPAPIPAGDPQVISIGG